MQSPELKHADHGLSRLRLTGGEELPLHTVIGIGRNYAKHAAEQGKAAEERIITFHKNPASIIAHEQEIVIPRACAGPPHPVGSSMVDYEGELAVIVGLGVDGSVARDVPEDRALGYVLAYTIANDVSARWWQKHGGGGQYNRGKSFDTFCPLGPRFATRDEIPDPQALRIVTAVGGRVMQDASTSEMTFPVATLISELSRDTTLLPGTVILTGTPSGVGMAQDPPRYLGSGDEVRVTIEPIGTLVNRVR